MPDEQEVIIGDPEGSHTRIPKATVYQTVDEWRAKAVELFGEDPRKWAFVCPACGNLQSGESVMRHNPELGATQEDRDRIAGWVNQICEGRRTESRGCDYTAGGLFNLCKVAVMFEGQAVSTFEFADPAADIEATKGNGKGLMDKRNWRPWADKKGRR